MTTPPPELVYIHIPKTAGLSIWKVVGRPEGVPDQLTHFSANQWKHLLGAERFDAAHVFAIVRHPLDRLLSAWSYLVQQRPNSPYWFGDEEDRQYVKRWSPAYSFEDFMLRVPDDILGRTHFRPETDWITLGGKLVPDTILSFETLSSEWESFARAHSLSPALQQTNGSTHKSWQDVFTDPMIDRAVEWYRDDFRLLGYRPDEKERYCDDRD